MAGTRLQEEDTRMRRSRSFVVALLVASLTVALPARPVNAYSTLGCKWSTATLKWRNAGSSAAYRDAATASIAAWDGTATPLAMTLVASGENIRVWDQNFGNSGFDGILLDQNYHDPIVSSCGGGTWDRTLYAMWNSYYTTAYTAAGKKSLMVHELGHAFGLAHTYDSICTDVKIMQWDTSTRYGICGKINPQADDVNGINFLY